MQHATATTISTEMLTPAQIAAVSFLARYQGHTHTLYTHRLRCWFAWCEAQGLDPMTGVKRIHVELYVRYRMLERGNSLATTHGVIGTIRGFFKFAVLDGAIDKDPAAFVYLPKLYTDDSKMLGLDRLELGTFLFTAKTLSPQHSALAHLLGLLGLRVSEACNVQIEDFADTVGGHRVLHLIGKGNKPATMPLTVPLIRALELAAGDRTSGPLLVRRKDGKQLTRPSAAAMVDTICRHAKITKKVSPHSLRHSFITNALAAGVPLQIVQDAARHADSRTTQRYNRNRHSLDQHAVHTLSAWVAGAS